jgi:hypothetical protein
MKKVALGMINGMPQEAMPVVLAQYQNELSKKQEDLAKPDIKESRADELKVEIQADQEIIEAIKKKMWQ